MFDNMIWVLEYLMVDVFDIVVVAMVGLVLEIVEEGVD